MITPAYVRQMSRYNAWQNKQIAGFLDPMDQADLTLDRGAFCKSILGTLNHLLWGDTMWMSRFTDAVAAPAPISTMEESTAITATGDEWWSKRQQMDATIQGWASSVDADALARDLTWYSGVSQATFTKPLADCTVHLFNHQTHHRGQVHAMITATGSKAPVSDIVFMPEP